MKKLLLAALFACTMNPSSIGQTKADVLSCIQKAGTDITSLQPCAQLAAGVVDHRISEAFQQLTVHPPGSNVTVAPNEADWHKFRAQACVSGNRIADFGCLQTLGAIQAEDLIKKIGPSYKYDPGEVPFQLWGSWTVRRVIPTRTITCWDDTQAQRLIGSTISYGPHTYRWKQVGNGHVTASVSLYDAQSFWSAYSSPASDGSQVDFTQLGIKAPIVAHISISGFADSERQDDGGPPGGDAFLISPERLVFEVCNVFFEAKKADASPEQVQTAHRPN